MIEENKVIHEIDEEDYEIKTEEETYNNKNDVYYIYKYTNKINNKIYVGLCKDPLHRQKAHKSAAERGKNSCPLFYNAIRKYGYYTFTFEIIEEVKGPEAANIREIYWIDKLNARDNNKIGYNISMGGGGRGNPNNTDTHRQCGKCKIIKLLSENFNSCPNSPLGKGYKCKKCVSEDDKINRDIRKANTTQEELDEINRLRRERYENDPELRKQIIAESKRYSDLHKEERKKYILKYREEHKEERKEKNRKEYAENAEERKEESRKDRKERSVINRELSDEQIYQNKPFKICSKSGCGLRKASTEFYIDYTERDSLGRMCVSCRSKRGKERYLKKKAAKLAAKQNIINVDLTQNSSAEFVWPEIITLPESDSNQIDQQNDDEFEQLLQQTEYLLK